MKIVEDMQPLIDKRAVTLLFHHNIKTVSQLLSTKCERLSSILTLSYTAVCKLRQGMKWYNSY